MNQSYRLEREQWLPRPLEEVFGFFSDAANLEEITPDFLRFEILTPRPIPVREGTLIDYKLRLFGIPMKWRSQIVSFEPPHRFRDVQIVGPYRHWDHLHEFAAERGGTTIRDLVDYALPFGAFGRLAHPWLVRPSLRRIFDYRQERLSERFS